jgi:AsmA-like C-terminal region
MYHLHLTRNLRSLAFLLVVAAVLTSVGALWWANHTGLPAPWRTAVEQQIAKQGAFVKIGSLRYAILQGIIATDVRVYSEPEHLREISRLERVILDCDKTKLARGIVQLNKIQLDRARLILPVDPKNPDSETLHVTDAEGTIFMPGDQRIEVRDAHGKIAGIDVALNARLIWFRHEGPKPADNSNVSKRRILMAKILGELGKWRFDEKRPPAIQISIDGDINDYSSLTAKLGLQIQEMEKNDHILHQVSAEAEMTGDLVTVSSLRASDANGIFQGHIDYNLVNREGRFDVSSSLEIPDLLTAWLGIRMPKDVLLGGKQTLESEGDFVLDEHDLPQFRLAGHVRCDWVTLRGASFETVGTAFSWRDSALFLRDLKLVRGDGQAQAKAMVEWPLVRLEAHSTLPVAVYRQLIAGMKLPFEIVLDRFSEQQGSNIDITAEGGFDLTNPLAWAYTGHGTGKNISYNGVPVNTAKCKFSLNHHELDFYDGSVNFDYSKYTLRSAFDGARDGNAKVARIRYDSTQKLVEVEDIRGSMWSAPVVRMFAPKVADLLEQYRFHQPPEMKASGVVDVTPQGRTALDISFRSEQAADYTFLGENLTLGQPRGEVFLRGDQVKISNLKLNAFGGPVAGNIDYTAGGKLRGDLAWTQLSIPELTSAYGFQMKSGGDVTGRIKFSLTDNKVETLSGEGALALEKAELFSVPIFGPLTPLIATVLSNEKAGTQQARSAFCTYQIASGILTTHDFQTSTSSLNFAGDGSVNLADRTLDMTMRMNTRGFMLGLITLPLRPFSELFQFHGSGPLRDTKWESMKFTTPSATQQELLMDPPKAKVVPTPRE